MNQYPFVRADSLCVWCGEKKDKGLLLCWPCHHTQKDRNDGDYGRKAYSKLDQRESLLASRKG